MTFFIGCMLAAPQPLKLSPKCAAVDLRMPAYLLVRHVRLGAWEYGSQAASS